MKKQIFLFGTVILLSMSADAQVWGTSAAQTYTPSNTGIGVPAVPADSRLYVTDEEYIDMPGNGLVTLKMKKDFWGNSYHMNHIGGNIMEGWTQLFLTAGPKPAICGFVLDPNFYMSIGTNIPVNRLTVHDGGISMTSSYDPSTRGIMAHTSSGSLSLMANTSNTNGASVELFGETHARTGSVDFTNYGDRSTFTFNKNISGNTEKQITIDDQGDIWMHRPAGQDAEARQIRGTTHKGLLAIYANSSVTDGAYMEMWGLGHSVRGGEMAFISPVTLNNPNAFSFIKKTYASWESLMHIRHDGKVVIGDGSITIPNSPNYKLIVQAGILTERLKVAMSSDNVNWSDFVFDDDYKLMPLSEVESFIEKNNHLPEIPSTAEVTKNGIDVAEMDAKLLQKIEELTLYVIEQQKQINALQKKLEKKGK